MKYAPIVLFVYNRPWHTRQTVEALQKNELATKSDLFIFADGPKILEHIHAVREVREYVRTIDGFRSVAVFEREENYGLAQSIISGITKIINEFGEIIVLEDDMMTSPFFLRFMNDALKRYEDDDRVISIHGYMYPVRGQLPKTFFLMDTGCWGWATWRRGWKLFNVDGASLLDKILRNRLSYAFDMDASYGFTKMLRRQVQGGNDSWAIRWQASAFIENKLTLFPGISLVNNIGHDHSGVHSVGTNVYDVKLADNPIEVAAIPVKENSAARKQLREYFLGLYATSIERFLHRAIAAVRFLARN